MKPRTVFELMLLILACGTSLMWFSGATTEYKQVKPMMAIITAEPATIKLVGHEFAYDPLLSIYESVDLTLVNEGTQPVSITASCILFDIENQNIASGQKTIDDIGANQTIITKVMLEWEHGKTVLDYVTVKLDVY